MEIDEKHFYITTPIYYVNDAPHLGHAYTTIAADVLARWHRQRGKKVWFLTGTDEHGQKILRTAEANNTTPQKWCDNLVETAWKPLWKHLNISNDDFIRTTNKQHETQVQKFVQNLYNSDNIYKKSYTGYYCVGCEEYKPKKELLTEQNLCPIHKKPVELLKEENYFFKLSNYQQQLLNFYEQNPNFVSPKSAKNEVYNFVSQGLEDLSISRSSFDWGIPVPWDKKQVIYVWVDALLNYATAVSFENPFPANVHLVGKDILRFHAIIWPALLMAANLPLPKKVVANGWLLVGGEKMSKTNLTGISPQQLTQHFGVDAYRYYFLRAIPYGSDGSFSWEDFQAKYQAELANGFGNLVARVIVMVEKYFSGIVPEPGSATIAETDIKNILAEAAKKADTHIDTVEIHETIAAIWVLVDALNGYIAAQQPWKVAKNLEETAQKRLATILYTAVEGLRALTVLLYPIMPNVCQKLWVCLEAEKTLGKLAEQKIVDVSTWGQLPAGSLVTKPEALFPRLDFVD